MSPRLDMADDGANCRSAAPLSLRWIAIVASIGCRPDHAAFDRLRQRVLDGCVGQPVQGARSPGMPARRRRSSARRNFGFLAQARRLRRHGDRARVQRMVLATKATPFASRSRSVARRAPAGPPRAAAHTRSSAGPDPRDGQVDDDGGTGLVDHVGARELGALALRVERADPQVRGALAARSAEL